MAVAEGFEPSEDDLARYRSRPVGVGNIVTSMPNRI
jgi:hypothetical protein